MQILVTIGLGFSCGAGVEFPTFPLTYAVVLKTLALSCQSVIIAKVVIPANLMQSTYLDNSCHELLHSGT